VKPPRSASAELKRPGVSAADVEAWLLAHPDFLAQRPELYLALEPPQRVHGERMADHMAAMLAAARVHLREAESEAHAHPREHAGFAQRTEEAILALLRAPDALECVTQEWPTILNVDACHVGCETTQRRHVNRLPAGTLAQVLPPGRSAVIRAAPIHMEPLHRESAHVIRRDALARVPAPGGQPMLLALGVRDAEALPASSVDSIVLLGRAVGAALAR
jgi:uncharacterized protein